MYLLEREKERERERDRYRERERERSEERKRLCVSRRYHDLVTETVISIFTISGRFLLVYPSIYWNNKACRNCFVVVNLIGHLDWSVHLLDPRDIKATMSPNIIGVYVTYQENKFDQTKSVSCCYQWQIRNIEIFTMHSGNNSNGMLSERFGMCYYLMAGNSARYITKVFILIRKIPNDSKLLEVC